LTSVARVSQFRALKRGGFEIRLLLVGGPSDFKINKPRFDS
jgi:hypothetical protein